MPAVQSKSKAIKPFPVIQSPRTEQLSEAQADLMATTTASLPATSRPNRLRTESEGKTVVKIKRKSSKSTKASRLQIEQKVKVSKWLSKIAQQQWQSFARQLARQQRKEILEALKKSNAESKVLRDFDDSSEDQDVDHGDRSEDDSFDS